MPEKIFNQNIQPDLTRTKKQQKWEDYRLKIQELIDQMISNREYLNDKDI